MLKVKPGAVVTKGLDVSTYDAVIDFTEVKAAGFEFVVAKCTEGATIADRFYLRNKQEAKAAGLLFGAYHFFRPGTDAKRQAENFLGNAQLEKGELQPMFDWEVSQGPGDIQKAQTWLDEVERACGKKPFIYGPPYMLNDLRLPESFKEYPLWVANYGVSAPLVPAPWRVWSFWQYSDRGEVPGIPSPQEDMDIFNGPLSQLQKMVI